MPACPVVRIMPSSRSLLFRSVALSLPQAMRGHRRDSGWAARPAVRPMGAAARIAAHRGRALGFPSTAARARRSGGRASAAKRRPRERGEARAARARRSEGGYMVRLREIAGALLVLVALAAPAAAQNYPSKPVRLLVPYPAGGAVDIVGRLFGNQLAAYWSQQVVIDNKPGAGGVIATEALLQNPPDGYTLILVASGHAVNPAMYGKLSYDIDKDFTAIS